MIYTYLIKSLKSGIYYTGISADPKKRLLEHNLGKLRTTSIHKPFALVYHKAYANYQEARKHELWLKKKNRKYKDSLYLPL